MVSMLFFQFLPLPFKVFNEMDFYGRQLAAGSFLELVIFRVGFQLCNLGRYIAGMGQQFFSREF